MFAFVIDRRLQIASRVLLILVIVFNALAPTAAIAMSLPKGDASAATVSDGKVVENDSGKISSRPGQPHGIRASIVSQVGTPVISPVEVASPSATATEPPTPEPSLTPTATAENPPTATAVSPTSTSTVAATPTPSATPATVQPPITANQSSTLSFQFSATPAEAAPGDQVTFTLQIANNGSAPVSGLLFSNTLPPDFGNAQNGFKDFDFDPKTRLLTWSGAKAGVPSLAPSQTLNITYTVRMNGQQDEVQVVDSATLNADGLAVPLSANATLTLLAPQKQATMIDSKGGKALGLNGHVQVDLPQDAVNTVGQVVIQDLGNNASSAPSATNQPWMEFSLGLRLPKPENAQSLSPKAAAGARQEQDEIIPLEPVEAKFDQPVDLTVSFDGLADLSTLGADQTPFIVTLDETSGTWVRMPLKSIDPATNQVTAETTHFSTWGAGIGSSFPTGGSLLLFDTSYSDLFTGRSHYSLPLWTPPGRNGMAPSLALSYSSGTTDGVLGDIQAPWVGMGWSVDSVEIARKITNGVCGTGCGGGSYGYQNKFLLLFNGTGYELLADATTPGRYHTKSESFLYIQLHNNNLGNNTPAASNATSEWWEVVQKDGTRWRLGATSGSEQLAAMKGYPGAATGAWATLGYAGSTTDVVAERWRADQVTDTHGNQMTFTYFEETRAVAGIATTYDRASYLDTITYTGDSSGVLTPGYSVVFVRESRGTNEVPTTVSDWDDWDTYRLNHIEVRYGATVIRTYTMGYTMDSQSDGSPVVSWQTTELTSVAISGGTAVAPTITFAYVDQPNRAPNGTSSVEWAYPRLQTVSNGWGGSSTFTYGNDGRAYTSWYNWRITNQDISDGVAGHSAMTTTYAYSTPCYNDPTAGWCNASNAGELIGYGQTTVTTKDFGGSTTLAVGVHKFYTGQQNTGLEYDVLRQNAAGTTLSETSTTYTTVTTGFPAGGYFTYASAVDEYVSGSRVSHTEYVYDATTGNMTFQKDYDGTPTLYRQTEYQYSLNTSPSVWILDALVVRILTNAAGTTVSREGFGYDGRLPNPSGTPPSVGDLTLHRWTNGSETIDTTYIYDAYGNITETRQFKTYGTAGSQPSGLYVSYLTSYDPALKTYVVSSDPPLIPATTTNYNFGLGLPTTVTDANGNTTTTAYDGLGRITSVTYPGSPQQNVKYTYPTSPVSAPFGVKMELWDQTASVYRAAWQMMDGLGRLIQTQSPYETAGMLVINDTLYNAQGLIVYSGLPRTISGTDGNFFAPTWTGIPHTTTTYDALGRTASVAYPDNSSETFTYSGLRTTAIDRNSHEKIQENDAFGRLVKVEEYTGSNPYTLYATTLYNYDVRDLLAGVSDNAGNATTITYDRYSRKTALSDPDIGSWSYGYDALGNLTTQTDARTCVTTVTYDDLNRPTGKTYSGPGACATTPAVGYTYDAIASGNEGWGRRTGMTDGGGSTTWSYNVLGQIANEVHALDGTNFTITTSYDAFGRPLTQTVPSQGSTENLTYAYNAMGLLSSLANGSSTYVSAIHHNASGQVTDQSLGNGLVQQFCYDANTLRLTALRAYPGTLQACGTVPSTPSLNLSYSYQANGNVSQVVDATRSETLNFAYDELNRLNTVTGSYSQNYAYNAIGNITTKNTATYTYGNAAHKHAVTGLSSGESYTYDANGNMITRVEGGITYTQTFDAENHLVSITTGGQTTRFVYDGDGNLVRKINPDNTYVLYVKGIYESYRNSGGTTTSTKTFYPAGGAMRVDGTRYYILKDNLGSASVVTNQSATVVGEDRFYPFGETRVTTGNMQTDKLFTGQRQITGLGIYHFGARFYSPLLGRFLSADTIVSDAGNPQNLNRYSYVMNNPLRYIDPTGHKCVSAGPGDCTTTTASGKTVPINGAGGLTPAKKPGGGGSSSGGGGATPPAAPNPVPSSGGILPSPLPVQGGTSTSGQQDSCTLTPAYLCQLSQDDQNRIANGQSYTVDVTSNPEAVHRNGVYAVLVGLPTVIAKVNPLVAIGLLYLGGIAGLKITDIPGNQAGDARVDVGHAVGEDFVYNGQTYNTEVVTNTYYFRNDQLIWTQTDVTTAYPTTRTY